jgi:hypothetical protein
VALTCNPSYSGSRDQKDHSSKPAEENSSQDPIWKKSITTTKRTGGVTQGVGPEFKPQHCKKKSAEGKKSHHFGSSIHSHLTVLLLGL